MGTFNCCCDGEDPGECCDPDTEVAPEISIAGYTESGHFGNNCCRTYDFVPISTEPAYSCCETLVIHSARVDCKHEDFIITKKPPIVLGAPPDCPFPQEFCCYESLKVAEFQQYTDLEYITKIAADFYITSLRVVYGRELIQCDPETEPVCRYFIRTILRGYFTASINTQRNGVTSFSNTYIHPCFVVSPGYEDDYNEGTSCNDEEICVSNPPIDSPCVENRGSKLCFTINDEFCIQRIKFFDTKPTGAIILADTDVIGDCTEPECGDRCGDYDQQVCVSSPVAILPPHWCDEPPTVARESTTYTLDDSACDSISGVIDTESCIVTVKTCDPQTPCDTPESYTVHCDSIAYPDWDIDPLECRLMLDFPVLAYEPCTCYNTFLDGFFTVPWYFGRSAAVPCITDDCYEKIDCDFLDGPCFQKYPDFGQYGKNEITITINCGSYAQETCCFAPGVLELTLS
jgi:hypothetical protein